MDGCIYGYTVGSMDVYMPMHVYTHVIRILMMYAYAYIIDTYIRAPAWMHRIACIHAILCIHAARRDYTFMAMKMAINGHFVA